MYNSTRHVAYKNFNSGFLTFGVNSLCLVCMPPPPLPKGGWGYIVFGTDPVGIGVASCLLCNLNTLWNI